MTASLLETLRAQPQFRAIRRDLHAHPELGFQEHRTAAVVARLLREYGWSVTEGVGGTGVVGVLRRGGGTRAIGLRADMDALPIEEANQFDHRSRHPGRMHACGHDGHTASLLAAAWYLAAHGRFDGTVHCIFQPAEEGGQAGAKAMIDDGLFDRFPCDAVFGLHNSPGLPVGSFGVRSGPFMASSNRFSIEIHGQGAHASQPDQGTDPLVCAAQMLLALQTVVSRNRPPSDSSVLSVTQIHGGAAFNVIPERASLAGTVRSHDGELLDLIERRMQEIVRGTAQAFGCRATLQFERNYPPLVNHERETRIALAAMRRIASPEQIHEAARLMNSEDFAFMLQQRPGCYVLVGNGDGSHREMGHGLGPCQVHNASYDFNDEVIPVAAGYFVSLVQSCLG